MPSCGSVTERADQAFLDALSAVAAALGTVRAPSMIIEGIAVIARGVPRQTVDVDATVWEREALDRADVVDFGGVPIRVAKRALGAEASAARCPPR